MSTVISASSVTDPFTYMGLNFTYQKSTEMKKSLMYVVEVCMGMGKTGIPLVPCDSNGNGRKISHGMGLGMGWEWELSA